MNWPPAGYRLRYAEWGVFSTAAGGNGLEAARAQLDEVPPFVHRVGNPAKELAERITPYPQNVWKPVIHLTADRAMAVDLQVCLAGGRPWVAFPRIDDLAMVPRPGALTWNRSIDPGMAVGVQPEDIEQLDPTGLTRLDDLREGYPWLTPRHRAYRWESDWSSGGLLPASKLAAVGGIGVRWQSLIVSPARLAWMTPPDVGADPRFAWWERLRGVECSWVSSRGEADRLLYYDGPRFRPLAGTARREGGRVSFDVAGTEARRSCYVRVTKGRVATIWTTGSGPDGSVEAATATARTVEEAVAEFRDAAVARGLTASEAGGLAACWRRAFFETAGERVLTFMTAQDYDDACPMVIRPQPTVTARVGILWTEFP